MVKTVKAKVLEEYIKFRSLKNKSRAIHDIKFHINRFINSTKKPLKDFDEKVLVDYLTKINSEYKTSTLNSIRSSYIKNFIKWHFDDWSSRFRNLDTLCKTEQPGETYKPEQMLSQEEFEKLMKGEETTFWKAYFMTLFYGGCRPCEVCELTWDNVDFEDEGAFITIFSNKNKRSFIKFVPQDVAFYLKQLQENNNKFVFYNLATKNHVTVKGAYWKLVKLSEKVLKKRVNLYLLRHSIATIIYNKDYMKDDEVARQLGHTKSMKSKYVHNDIEQLKETARKIYLNAENLPPEKKHALEKEIDALKKQMNTIVKNLGPGMLLGKMDHAEMKAFNDELMAEDIPKENLIEVVEKKLINRFQ